jgi:hypothetical protein
VKFSAKLDLLVGELRDAGFEACVSSSLLRVSGDGLRSPLERPLRDLNCDRFAADLARYCGTLAGLPRASFAGGAVTGAAVKKPASERPEGMADLFDTRPT